MTDDPRPAGLSDADILRGRVLVHLEEIEMQRDSFDRAGSRLGKTGFVAAWAREGTPDQVDDKGSLERAYEQVVNDLHGIFDAVEAEAARVRLAPPVPPGATYTPDALKAWWQAADELGLPVAAADRSAGPGRWRRLAFYGHIDHDLATVLGSWCDTRNLFQHGYARRNRRRGAEVWEVMHALRAELPSVLGSLVAFRDVVVARLDRT